MARPVINLIRLHGRSILDQIRLEEALLRTDKGNFAIFNTGFYMQLIHLCESDLNKKIVGTTPTAVLGISGKPDVLLHPQNLVKDGIPTMRRFTGGGTVFVDQGLRRTPISTCTVGVILVCRNGVRQSHNEPRCCPRGRVLSWPSYGMDGGVLPRHIF